MQKTVRRGGGTSVKVRDYQLRYAAAARLVLIVCGIWMMLGLFMGVQIYLNALGSERNVSIAWAFSDSIRRYLIYGLLTFPVLWLCRRFPLESGRWRESLAVHAVACGAFVLVYAIIRSATAVDPDTMKRFPLSIQSGLSIARRTLYEQSWMYSSIVTVILTFQSYQKIRQREIEEADLKRRLSEYELQILKLQLHPHFLFNTLNSISVLMTRDVKTAREMLGRLADLLRIALAHTRDKEVPVGEELAFIQLYLELEQMRLGDRLHVEMRIDPEALEARVPNMLLQPLVENSIRHGVAAIRSGGRVDVTVARVNDSLRIEIVNDGPPFAEDLPPEQGRGTGLSNSRARLRQLYGDRWTLSLSNRTPGGVAMRLEIPFQRANQGERENA